MFDMMRGGMMGSMGNPDAAPADSFQGGLGDLEAALMETNGQEIDELQARAQQGGQNQQDMMLMQLMQMMGGM